MYETDPNAGAIALTTKYHGMTFMMGLFRPLVIINGHRVPITWGRTVIPMPAGQHHVHVHVPYLLPPRIGPADTVVPVYPGQTVEVEYRAPIIGWMGGSIGPPPQQYRGMAGGIVLMIVPFVVLLCIFGLLGILTVSDSPARRSAVPAPVTPTSAAADPTPSTSSSSVSGKPTLKATPARRIVGPSWTASDKTYTMGISGVPFAFRTPATWGCVKGKIEIPDAKAWVCLDEGKPFEPNAPEPDRGKRLQFMLRPCPGSCTSNDRLTLSRDWFDDGAKINNIDARTSYVEIARNPDGRYILDMSHFITLTDGAQWQVAVGTYSQPESKAVVQKIVNDMLTQAG